MTTSKKSTSKPAQDMANKKANRTYEGQKKYNKKPEALAKRVEDNKARKDLGLKVGDKRDASRKGNGFVAEDRSANRSRGGKIGNKEGKAAGGRKSKRGPSVTV